MANRDFKSISKDLVAPTGPEVTMENIKLGCAQRMATATEAIAVATQTMATNYLKLQGDLNYYRDAYSNQVSQNNDLERSNASLRGVITRKNKIIKALQDGSNSTAAGGAAKEV